MLSTLACCPHPTAPAPVSSSLWSPSEDFCPSFLLGKTEESIHTEANPRRLVWGASRGRKQRGSSWAIFWMPYVTLASLQKYVGGCCTKFERLCWG